MSGSKDHLQRSVRLNLEILEGRLLPNNLLSVLSLTPPPYMFKRTVECTTRPRII